MGNIDNIVDAFSLEILVDVAQAKDGREAWLYYNPSANEFWYAYVAYCFDADGMQVECIGSDTLDDCTTRMNHWLMTGEV